MILTNGNQYTMNFSLTGTYWGVGSAANDAANQLVTDGFPVSGITAKTNGGLGGLFGGDSIDITFVYTGADTDDASFGNACATDMASGFAQMTFTYTGVTAGAAKNNNILDTAKSLIGVNSGGSAGSNMPNTSTLLLIAGGFLLLLVAIFGFSEGFGNRVA